MCPVLLFCNIEVFWVTTRGTPTEIIDELNPSFAGELVIPSLTGNPEGSGQTQLKEWIPAFAGITTCLYCPFCPKLQIPILLNYFEIYALCLIALNSDGKRGYKTTKSKRENHKVDFSD